MTIIQNVLYGTIVIAGLCWVLLTLFEKQIVNAMTYRWARKNGMTKDEVKPFLVQYHAQNKRRA